MNSIFVQPNPIYVEQFLLSIQIQRVAAAYDDYVYCMHFDDKCCEWFLFVVCERMLACLVRLIKITY